jgi:hypothetical protein
LSSSGGGCDTRRAKACYHHFSPSGNNDGFRLLTSPE